MTKPGLKVISFSLLNRPSDWSTTTLDYNIAYRISLEIAKQVLSNKTDGLWFNEELKKKKDLEEIKEDKKRSREEGALIAAFIGFGVGSIFIGPLIAGSVMTDSGFGSGLLAGILIGGSLGSICAATIAYFFG